jgi:hypothetical protein
LSVTQHRCDSMVKDEVNAGCYLKAIMNNDKCCGIQRLANYFCHGPVRPLVEWKYINSPR